MSYEKYIKKDGKMYGPYIYHSKRVDGKVISEYQGQKKIDYLKFIWIVPLVLLIVFGAYFLSQKKGSLTGNAVLNLNANYQEGKTLNGGLDISLNQGELIPASSKVTLKNAGQKYEYSLQDLVSEQTAKGNFFVPGTKISGSGQGFGLLGTRKVHPEVQFTLIITSSSNIPGSQGSPVATPTENSSSQNTSKAPAGTNNTKNTSATSGTTPTSNITPSTSSNTPNSSVTQKNSSTSPINVIANFFLGLTPTGKVITQSQREVQGSVSAGNVFTYTLQQGETAEIKPLSVKTNLKQLSESSLSLTTQGNLVSVLTNYTENEEGFGSNYSGGNSMHLTINLDKLNLSLQKGELNVSVSYQGEEIASVKTNLGNGQISGTSPIVPKQNNSQINKTTNITVNSTSTLIPVINQTLNLTDAERAVLIKQFGNFSVQTTEATTKNGFIVIRNQLGNYWIENSYSSDLDNATLFSFMKADRIKWLKDIAQKLSEQVANETKLTSFVGNYSV